MGWVGIIGPNQTLDPIVQGMGGDTTFLRSSLKSYYMAKEITFYYKKRKEL